MSKDQLLDAVNQSLRAKLAELQGQHENPHIIDLCLILIRLTNSPEQNAAEVESTPDPKVAQRAEIQSQMDALQKQLTSL